MTPPPPDPAREGPPAPVVRPGPGGWLWYALSGRLHPRHHRWAFHDLTCRTWPLRHLARLLVPVVPVAAALVAVLPGPLAVRVEAVTLGAVVGLAFTFVFLHDSTDHRAVRFGYPPGAAQAARDGRQVDRSLAEAADEFERRSAPPADS